MLKVQEMTFILIGGVANENECDIASEAFVCGKKQFSHSVKTINAS